MIVNRDLVEELRGSWGSGLAVLYFQSGRQVYCDNGATVRALDAATNGAFIAEGHTFDNSVIHGLDICWSDDGITLEGFTLTEEYPELNAIPLGGTAEVNDLGNGLEVEVLDE